MQNEIERHLANLSAVLGPLLDPGRDRPADSTLRREIENPRTRSSVDARPADQLSRDNQETTQPVEAPGFVPAQPLPDVFRELPDYPSGAGISRGNSSSGNPAKQLKQALLGRDQGRRQRGARRESAANGRGDGGGRRRRGDRSAGNPHSSQF